MDYIKGGIIVKTGTHIFRMQFCHMLARTEFKISLTAVLLVIGTSFYTICSHVYGNDQSQLYSAAYGWMGHAAILDIQIMQIFFILFIFFIGSMAFADSQFVDKKLRIRDIIVTRCSLYNYVISGGIVSFIGAFLVILVPFLFSLCLSYILFPIHGAVPQGFYNTPSWQNDIFTSFLSPMYYNHPFIYDIVAIFYMSFCAGVFAVFSFALSFYIKRGRLLIIGLPTILVIVESALFPGASTFTNYLFMGYIIGQTFQFYIGFPLVILLLSCILIWAKTDKRQDELS